MQKRVILPPMLILAAISGVFLWYSTPDQEQQETPQQQQQEQITYILLEDEYQTISYQTARTLVSGQGILEPIEQASIASKTSGEIISFHLKKGDIVEKNQDIATLQTQYLELTLQNQKAQLDQIEAQITQAQTQLERTQALRARNTASLAQEQTDESALAVLEAQKRASEALFNTTRLDIENANITSPISGLITDIPVSLGDSVNNGGVIATVSNISDLILEIDADPIDAKTITQGADVEIILTYDNETLSGAVERVIPVAQTQNRKIPIRIRIKNPEMNLYSGIHATANITTKEFPNSIIIPKTAIREDENSMYVLVINNDKAIKRDILVNNEWVSQSQALVSKGLDDGDVVITSPLEQISDGDNVEVDS